MLQPLLVRQATGEVVAGRQILTLPEWVRAKIHAGKLSYATAIRNRTPTGTRQGGSRELDGTTASLVSHWRRRHDRLLAGIHAVLKARPRDVPEFRMMLDRLLKLDLQALDGPSENGQAT